MRLFLFPFTDEEMSREVKQFTQGNIVIKCRSQNSKKGIPAPQSKLFGHTLFFLPREALSCVVSLCFLVGFKESMQFPEDSSNQKWLREVLDWVVEQWLKKQQDLK